MKMYISLVLTLLLIGCQTVKLGYDMEKDVDVSNVVNSHLSPEIYEVIPFGYGSYDGPFEVLEDYKSICANADGLVNYTTDLSAGKLKILCTSSKSNLALFYVVVQNSLDSDESYDAVYIGVNESRYRKNLLSLANTEGVYSKKQLFEIQSKKNLDELKVYQNLFAYKKKLSEETREDVKKVGATVCHVELQLSGNVERFVNNKIKVSIYDKQFWDWPDNWYLCEQSNL